MFCITKLQNVHLRHLQLTKNYLRKKKENATKSPLDPHLLSWPICGYSAECDPTKGGTSSSKQVQVNARFCPARSHCSLCHSST